MDKGCIISIALFAALCMAPLASSTESGNPAWVDDLIALFSAQPVGNPPQSIYSYEYKGQTVYYVAPQCCDQYSRLYDAEGTLLCAPDGGIIGSGDGRCPDFCKERKNERLIWRDHRRPMSLRPGGSASHGTTGGENPNTQSGYARLEVHSGSTPYGTAIFSYKQNGITLSEAGVPVSPATNHARVFIDYRFGVPAIPGRPASGTVDINTGISLVNSGSSAAGIAYTLLNASGSAIAAGHGTLAAGSHIAQFIDQFSSIAQDFVLPENFQFATLDIASDQPLSVLAVRMTMNQRNEPLFSTTPVADMNQASTTGPLLFPQLADGGGYATSLVLLNTSSSTEQGTIQIFDDNGQPFVVQPVEGAAGSSFPYSIPPGGTYRLQTDGASAIQKAGWLRVTPAYQNNAPVGSGLFGYNPADILLTESGVPAAQATTHARIYVDLTKKHNTGLAVANLSDAPANLAIQAVWPTGTITIGTSPGLQLPVNGHAGKFAAELVSGVPTPTYILDISADTPFAATTLRSLDNERGDFLLTAFPIAYVDRAAPSPIIFPQIADGGGYTTEFILLSPGGAADTYLILYDNAGVPIQP
jgi:hypothetical protein